MFDYELMPKCRRAAALGGIVLPMNNCPSSRALGQRRPCHRAGIRDGSSEEKARSSAQGGKGLRDARVDESGRKHPTTEIGPFMLKQKRVRAGS